jgi:DNA-binding transcriptional LysR family regulator
MAVEQHEHGAFPSVVVGKQVIDHAPNLEVGAVTFAHDWSCALRPPHMEDDRTMRPTLRQLEVLVAVADAGSFVSAARDLGLDQSSVSRAITALERAVGTALVIRNGRGALLTPAGHRILASARQALRLVDDIRDETASGVVQGRVTVGSFRSGAAFLLPPVVTDLAQEHPGIEIAVVSIREADGGVGAAVASGRCDIGLVSLPTQPQLQVTELTEDPYVRVEPAVRPPDDPPPPFIHWDEDCSHRALEWLEATGRRPEAIVDVEDDQVVLAFVAHGLGWSLMPALAARPHRPEVRLRALHDGPHRTIGVCVQPGVAQRPAVAAVLEALRNAAD